MKPGRNRLVLFKRVSREGGFLGTFFFDNVQRRYERLRKRVKLWASLSTESLRRNPKFRMAMISLTYDALGTKVKASAWRPDDVQKFMKTFRGRMGKRLKAYCWVAELQANGNVHYHILVWYTGWIAHPDKDTFHGGKRQKRIWNYGSSRVDIAIRTPFYVLKYTGKEYQKDFENFPPHARAFAVWISDEAEALDMRYKSLSAFDKALVDEYGFSELRRDNKKSGRRGNYEEWRRLRRDLLFDSEYGYYFYEGTYGYSVGASTSYLDFIISSIPADGGWLPVK